MKRTVALIILIFILLNISSFFVMKSRAPQYTVFTGAVHYPPDYLYYLSFITQGKDHWLLGANLKSAETRELQALNWFYVLGGHVGQMISLSSPLIYQLLVILASIAYLTAAYALFSVCFPKQPMTRLVAFVLFLVSNAFPKITHTAAGWDFNFFYPFNNLGHPFIRLSNVPHHTLIQASILAAFFWSARYWETKKYRPLILLGVAGCILGSMQPLQWAFVTGVIGLSGCVQSVLQYKKDHNKNWLFYIPFLLPSIALGLSGLPFALYIKQLYSGEIFAYMLLWEKNQQVIISFKEFILLHGPVMLIGIIGIPILVKKMNGVSKTLLFYGVISVLLFFSPIPAKLGLLNLRFVSVIPVFCAAYITAAFLRLVTQKVPQSYRFAAMWLGAFCVVAITIPVSYAHVVLGRPNTISSDINVYMPQGAYQLYETAKQTILKSENTLVTPLFAQSFAAFTGRHVYEADIFGTLNFEQKHREAADFFARRDTPATRLTWLKKQNIHYIFTFAWSPIPDMESLETIAKNEYAILYKVK